MLTFKSNIYLHIHILYHSNSADYRQFIKYYNPAHHILVKYLAIVWGILFSTASVEMKPLFWLLFSRFGFVKMFTFEFGDLFQACRVNFLFPTCWCFRFHFIFKYSANLQHVQCNVTVDWNCVIYTRLRLTLK